MMFLFCKGSFSIVLVLITMSLICDGREVELKYDVNLSDSLGPGQPLYLTPLIEQGRISEARIKSVVKPFIKNVESFAGYLTVDKNYNSNLFFWFFKADDKTWDKLPVAVWLQGGPGASSLLALFLENGPYSFDNDTLIERVYSWHKKCNVIYIDNPVGSGFSFTDHEDGYTQNQTIIGEHLYAAIKQFFILFPNLYKNDFYIAGESYAGKYVPTFAYAIYKQNALATTDHPPINVNDKVFINLKGLFIGNGLVDPPNMLMYGDYLYQLGLIDSNVLDKFHNYENQIKQAINANKWEDATDLFSELVLDYVYYPYGSLFHNATGFHEHYNYINLNPLNWNSHYTKFVMSDLFRRSVHVGDKPFNNGTNAAKNLKEDILKSVIDKVEELLSHYRITFYNGQLDIICAYPLTVNFIKQMNWSLSHEYATAERRVWRVKNDIAGYYKIAGNLTEVLVRDAGHMVPSDQSLWAYELFNDFITNNNIGDEL